MDWRIKPCGNPADHQRLKQALPQVSSDTIKLLVGRGIKTFAEAKAYFTPEAYEIPDPFLMKGMEAAVNRLSQAVGDKEKIMVYGDYDVDGTCSVSMAYLFLKELGAQVHYYIPDRYAEGYGVSEIGVQKAIDEEYSLIISIDCGIRAIDRVLQANAAGVDFIICDHHQPGDQVPPALAVLDPKQSDCPYPFKELCGCGVAYKLLSGFCQQQTIDQSVLENYIDLVTIATCSDIVPITGENRALVSKGLQKLSENPLPGIKALLSKAGLGGELNVRSVVFGLGPRINAAGRIGHANGAVELLISQTEEQAASTADAVELQNKERREVDKQITEEVLEILDNSLDQQRKKTTVLAHPNWHKGVIGIVASRAIESYHRPTIIMTKVDEMYTGSARSVGNFDILSAISSCGHLLHKYGGHKFAAGLSLHERNYEAFVQEFENVVAAQIDPNDLNPYLEIDLELPIDRVNFDFYQILSRMEPFGPANMQPVFVSRSVIINGEPKLLKEEHLKFDVKNALGNISCIGFGMKEHLALVNSGLPIDICYTLEVNEYRQTKSLQLMLRGIREAE